MFTRTKVLFMTAALTLSCSVSTSFAKDKKDSSPLSSDTFDGLAFRNIGPAFMSGRIADIAIDPNNKSTWYVGAGSGGVWKTINAGVTWQALFDKQSAFAIGAVVLDPQNSNTVWVGTGENVGGRHISFGDGVYRSKDGGNTWENMGLKESRHISEIIIHPKNPNIVWVAAQGNLWKGGGERGLFKSTDGGKNWTRTLGDDKWTGVTDIVTDPRNPDVMYAATWQRHRTVAAYYGGGPDTAIHKSVDGGDTWTKLKNGLPKTEMGKIGLAISPMQPDVVYAAIELSRRKGAVYRSDNRGASWTKGADAVAGGTGPHYYQELYVSPHYFDHVYLAGVRMQESKDGGKTFTTMKEEHKHSDNHAMEFVSSDKNYMMVGSDGGIYESFDKGENWRFINNLPITQYYKVAVDDDAPFYNIYGGTQDNNTQGGPSRTDALSGILNSDWKVVLFGDGHQPATEPGNPDIVYAEWQQGNLTRYDRTNGEVVYIKPQPEKGAGPERYNWDAPILVSPHNPTRLYFASHRVWRSENRGDTWQAISGDLTKNLERIRQPIMGGQQSWDGAWDIFAMSQYSTITSLAESPVQEGLLYAGTDDGHIQVSENGGKNWRKVDVDDLPKVPKTAFINDIKADLFDADTVYITLDNHKFGDFTPYVLKSTNRGKSWKSITSNLPDNHIVWRIVQDHVDQNLMFAGTEFGLFFTPNGGKKWIELNGGIPTISFRDLAIQRRENDLVAASFGRGFFILDDYTALRNMSEQVLKQESALFPIRKAWWYIEKGNLGLSLKGSQGASLYAAPNPEFGATFTYYLKDDIKTQKALRQKKEKDLKKDDKAITLPNWSALAAQEREQKPAIWFTVKNAEGNIVRRLSAPAKKGLQRVTWDLTWPVHGAVRATEPKGPRKPRGMMVAPGTYSVSMSKEVNGVIIDLPGSQSFEVEALRKNGALKGATPQEVAAFWQELSKVQGVMSAVNETTKSVVKKLTLLEKAMDRTRMAPGSLDADFVVLRDKVNAVNVQLNGLDVKNQVGAWNDTSIGDRLSHASIGTFRSTYGPTPAVRESLRIATQELRDVRNELDSILNQHIPAFEQKLNDAGAPWVPGQSLPTL